MKTATLLALSLLALVAPAAARAAETPAAAGSTPVALAGRLTSATARAAYEEFVAEVLAAVDQQAAAFAALGKDVSTLTTVQVREQLALLESLALTRTQISHGRRAILGCAQLTREESELLLGALAGAKARWDKLLGEEVPPRKAALNRQLEIAAVAIAAPPAPPAPAPRRPAEVLAAATRRLQPTGIASFGGEYQLLLDGQRMKAGQTIQVKLDREYTVTLAAVSRNSYTLALDGETLVVAME